MMKKYIIPDLVVVDLGMDDDVLQLNIATSQDTTDFDVKRERDFYDDSTSTPSRGSIWDNEW